MPDAWGALVDDLAAEMQVLHPVLSRLAVGAWDRPSPAEGWTLRDCVVHLAESDDSAAAIVETRRGDLHGRQGQDHAPGVEPQTRRRQGVLTAGQLEARAKSPDELRDWHHAAGQRLLSALRQLKGDERLTWAGRPMGARSFTSARLMEHWSHGLDILATAGVRVQDTDRLRHVAHMGYITRDFSYRNRGLSPPESSLRLELTSPSGSLWTWGAEDAADHISGPAGDFCRVVTQRIHLDDTLLVAQGPHAHEFLTIAQAFAGPTGTGRPPRAKPG